MRSSIWVLTSALLLLCVSVFVFIFFSQQELPTRSKLLVSSTSQVYSGPSIIVDSSYIYQNDIFGTYIAPALPVAEAISKFLPIPKVPLINTTMPVEPVQPDFLDPLPLTLSGVLLDSNEKNNRAIIINNKTKAQKTYKIGDSIEDAELLSIFDSSVLFVRSNGQEETLFINQRAAQEDPAFNSQNNWDGVILKEGDNKFFINPVSFIERIPNLAQFFELLDAATVYKKGKSFGVRIGKSPSESLAEALGLQAGDIIKSIFKISVLDTSDRIAVYNLIKEVTEGTKIPVKIIRNSEELENIYTLKILTAQEIYNTTETQQQQKSSEASSPDLLLNNNSRDSRDSAFDIKKERNILAQSQANFTSRIEQMQKRDKQSMMRRSGNMGLTRVMPA